MNREERERYSRQILFSGIGEEGQEKLLASSAVLIGCGALGTVTANLLVRAGLGRLASLDLQFGGNLNPAAADAFRGSRRARRDSESDCRPAPAARHQLGRSRRRDCR